MNLAEWCIKNNRVSILAFLMIALGGVYVFQTIGRLEDPEFTIRAAVVTSYFPGAAPRKVEELVTDKIEEKLQEMPEVDALTSQSLSGISVVFVEIKTEFKDMQPIWTRLRNKIDDVRNDLPSGVQGPVVNDEFGDVFPVVIALTGDGYSYRELKDIADDTREALLGLDDVAKVTLSGTQDERIFIDISHARLAELGFTPSQLADMLRGQNVLQPGGNALLGTERVTIEASGEFKSIEQLKQVSLRLPGRSETVYLQDIATIRRDFVDPPTTLTRFNTENCIMLSASMVEGRKVTDMGERVKAEIEKLQARQPVGVDYHVFLYQPKYVERAIDEFMGNLEESFVYVFIVMLLFAGLRMGLIAGILVPMAMLMCILFMPTFGIKLQSVSIASLIIALGMLVDNGVVSSENILVRLSAGQERMQACKEAVKELWLPLLTSSLTTIAAFLPIATAKSDVGEYCISLFQVITLTLMCSWVLSLTMIPMLCYFFLKPQKREQKFDSLFYRGYRAFLVGSLKHPLIFLAAIIALFGVSLWGFKFIPTIFFPPSAREMVLVDFWQPYGTDIRVTRDRVAELEKWLLANTNVASVGTFVGEGGPRWMLSLNIEQENANYANMIVTLHSPEAVDKMIVSIREHLDNGFPECRHTVKKLESGPPVGAPIKVRISGKDIDMLYRLRDRVIQAIQDVPGIINIRDDWGEWTKKLEIEVSQDQAKRFGLTSYDVAASLQSQISGLQATEFREGREVIPIELRAKGGDREDLGRIENLNVYSFQGSEKVPLLQIARSQLTWQPSGIRRRDRVRTLEVQTDVQGRFASEVVAEVQPKILALINSSDWPGDYKLSLAGENAESDKAQRSIMDGLPLAMAILVLILIYQFNSMRKALIIILTVPPMMIGVTPGLLLTDAPFGFMAFLGLISLMGVIVNNAIMLIDRMNVELDSGQTWEDAIVVSSHRRLRPILMTAITTIIGLAPLSLSGGEMWRPMANTIMAGLAVATALTLGLCPVLCSLFYRGRFRDYTWNPAVLKKSAAE